MNGEFNLNFLDHPTRCEANMLDYSDYFERYNPKKWEVEPHGGVFKFFSGEGRVYTCLFAHGENLGFVVQFGVRDRKLKKNFGSWITVSNKHQMDEFIDIGSDQLFSRGCFVSPEIAWKLIKEYLKEPTRIPDCAVLMDAREVPIPAVYR